MNYLFESPRFVRFLPCGFSDHVGIVVQKTSSIGFSEQTNLMGHIMFVEHNYNYFMSINNLMSIYLYDCKRIHVPLGRYLSKLLCAYKQYMAYEQRVTW